MCRLKIVVASAIAFTTIGSSVSVCKADTQSGFFIANSAATSVQYLLVNEHGQSVAGYLEAIERSTSAPGGLLRNQTFAKRRGEALSFGAYTAIRNADGYTLTSINRDGHIWQRRFFRSSIHAINTLITTLSTNVARERGLNDRSLDDAELRVDNSKLIDDAALLEVANAAVDAAGIRLSAAQGNAERLSRLARNARGDADASIGTPGVSYAQNQSRITAMANAYDAEQRGRAAQRGVGLCENGVAMARADVATLQTHIAGITQRARAAFRRLGNHSQSASSGSP